MERRRICSTIERTKWARAKKRERDGFYIVLQAKGGVQHRFFWFDPCSFMGAIWSIRVDAFFEGCRQNVQIRIPQSSRANAESGVRVSVRPTTRPVHIDPIELCIFNKQEEKNWFRVRSSVLFVKSGKSKSTDLSIRGASGGHEIKRREREGGCFFQTSVCDALLKRPMWMKAKVTTRSVALLVNPKRLFCFSHESHVWVARGSIFQLGALPPRTARARHRSCYIFLHCIVRVSTPVRSSCFPQSQIAFIYL